MAPVVWGQGTRRQCCRDALKSFITGISKADISHGLTTEAVEGTALALQGIDDIKRCDGLALGVLGVCDGVTDDALKEGLQNTTGLLVDHWAPLVSSLGCDCARYTYWLRYA